MTPLNSHIQVQPQTKDDFIASADTTYNEVGTVIAVAEDIHDLKEGDTVLFDSWMASKFPDGKGGYYWYIPYDNIKAYESVSKERVQGAVPPQVQDSTFTQSGASGAV